MCGDVIHSLLTIFTDIPCLGLRDEKGHLPDLYRYVHEYYRLITCSVIHIWPYSRYFSCSCRIALASLWQTVQSLAAVVSAASSVPGTSVLDTHSEATNAGTSSVSGGMGELAGLLLELSAASGSVALLLSGVELLERCRATCASLGGEVWVVRAVRIAVLRMYIVASVITDSNVHVLLSVFTG